MVNFLFLLLIFKVEIYGYGLMLKFCLRLWFKPNYNRESYISTF